MVKVTVVTLKWVMPLCKLLCNYHPAAEIMVLGGPVDMISLTQYPALLQI